MRWPDLVRLLETRMDEGKDTSMFFMSIFDASGSFVGDKAVFASDPHVIELYALSLFKGDECRVSSLNCVGEFIEMGFKISISSFWKLAFAFRS